MARGYADNMNHNSIFLDGFIAFYKYESSLNNSETL